MRAADVGGRTSSPGRVISFLSGQRRRDDLRIRTLERAHEEALEAQIRAAEHLEAALRELELASARAEQAAWELGVARQRKVHSVSFGTLMNWLAEICRLRNAGEHFCIADLVRTPEEPREP
jgi:hypothetical protein